jgi:hypothetical protein
LQKIREALKVELNCPKHPDSELTEKHIELSHEDDLIDFFVDDPFRFYWIVNHDDLTKEFLKDLEKGCVRFK